MKPLTLRAILKLIRGNGTTTIAVCLLIPTALLGFILYSEIHSFFINNEYCGYHSSCIVTYPGLNNYSALLNAAIGDIVTTALALIALLTLLAWMFLPKTNPKNT